MNIFNIIGTLIKIAIILGTMGAIGEVTTYFMKNSADAFQNGQVSLGAWNRQLISGSSKKYKAKKLLDH